MGAKCPTLDSTTNGIACFVSANQSSPFNINNASNLTMSVINDMANNVVMLICKQIPLSEQECLLPAKALHKFYALITSFLPPSYSPLDINDSRATSYPIPPFINSNILPTPSTSVSPNNSLALNLSPSNSPLNSESTMEEAILISTSHPFNFQSDNNFLTSTPPLQVNNEDTFNYPFITQDIQDHPTNDSFHLLPEFTEINFAAGEVILNIDNLISVSYLLYFIPI